MKKLSNYSRYYLGRELTPGFIVRVQRARSYDKSIGLWRRDCKQEWDNKAGWQADGYKYSKAWRCKGVDAIDGVTKNKPYPYL